MSSGKDLSICSAFDSKILPSSSLRKCCTHIVYYWETWELRCGIFSTLYARQKAAQSIWCLLLLKEEGLTLHNRREIHFQH